MMSRNRPLSFYYKESEENEDNADTLRAKVKSQLKINAKESVATFPRHTKTPFSGSTPILTSLLDDLEENPIFKQQKQKNRRSKSIDFLSTKPVILLSQVHNRVIELEKKQCTHQNQRKSFSATNLPVSL